MEENIPYHLHSLHGTVAGNRPDPACDDLLRLAVRLLGTPSAALILLDETQARPLAVHGTRLPPLPRAQSFSAHAVVPDQPFVIEDARTDARFRNSPLVTADPCVVFYASMPLVLHDGVRVGDLAVFDTVPHRLDDDAANMLRLLARQAVCLLELRLELTARSQARPAPADPQAPRAGDRDPGDERRALQLGRQLEVTLERMSDAFYLLDGDWRFLYFNAAAERLLRQQRDQVLGHTVWEAFPAIVGSGLEKVYREARASGRTGRLEYHYPPQESWYDVTAYPSGAGLAVYFRDITQQRAQLQTWRLLAESMPIIVWTARRDGVLDYVSPLLARYSGIPVEQLVPKGWLSLLHPDDRAPLLEKWGRACSTLEPFEDEYRLRRADGAYRWHLIRALPVHIDPATVVWYGSSIDIDDSKQLEQAARAALERRVQQRTAELETARRDLRNILDALPSLISYWDRNLVNRFANRAVRQWLGSDPDREPRPHLREMLGEALFEQSLPHAQAALRGEPQYFERSFARPDGQGRRHSVSYYLPDVVEGEVRGFYSLVHDVTEIVESRLALDRERRRLHDILHDTKVATWEWNVQTGETRFNERWAEIVGYRLDELQPVSIDTWLRLAHPDDLVRSGELLQRHFSGELDHYECEARMRHRDGHWIWVQDSGRVATWTADGKPQWMHGIHQDITERHLAALALRKAKQAAEAANAAKSAFLANMSHEIRTPMNAILGMAHLLGQGGLAPQHTQQLARIEGAARHLLSIINAILDLSKIDAGKLQLEERDFELPALLEQVRTIIGQEATAKGLRVQMDVAGVPPWLRGDDTRVHQALLNYAGNAVKFTDRGHVLMRARLLEERDGRLLVSFEVEDTGVGIDEQQLPRLFQAFEQADASTTRQHGGTGLGLAITRRLAELMGGAAGARARPGGGSIFWFTAWLRRGTPAGARRPAASYSDALAHLRHSGARVLLAEDNAVNREVALALLHNAGLAVDVAPDGQQALERLQQQRYDLVLMDMQMPVLDGLKATQALRALPGCSSLPVLALTANAFDEDRAACLAAGMNDFVSKPVEPQTLYATLSRWLQCRGSIASSPG